MAGAAEAVLPLHLGGAEGAGFLAGLAATAQLAAHLLEEPRLREALPALPEAMARALEGEEGLEVGEGLFVLGPGFAYPVALEAALRLKEAGLRAEGVAAPEELFPAGLPLLVLVGRDGVLAGLIPALEGLKARGVPLFVLSPSPRPWPSPTSPCLSPWPWRRNWTPSSSAWASTPASPPAKPTKRASPVGSFCGAWRLRPA